MTPEERIAKIRANVVAAGITTHRPDLALINSPDLLSREARGFIQDLTHKRDRKGGRFRIIQALNPYAAARFADVDPALRERDGDVEVALEDDEEVVDALDEDGHVVFEASEQSRGEADPAVLFWFDD